MADIAVTSALVLAEKVLSYLHQETELQKTVCDGVEEIKSWLMTMLAYLKDTEGQEGNEGQKDRVRQVREHAAAVLEGLMKGGDEDLAREFRDRAYAEAKVIQRKKK